MKSVCRCSFVLSLLFGLLCVFPAGAQPRDADAPNSGEFEEIHGEVRTFFEKISNPSAGPKDGLEELLKNSPFEEGSKEEMINALADKIKGITQQFGNYVSFEPIGVKKIGRDLVVLRYLYKCQNYPLVWYFIYYRPLPANGEPVNKPWQLIHLYYDSQLNIPLWESEF